MLVIIYGFVKTLRLSDYSFHSAMNAPEHVLCAWYKFSSRFISISLLLCPHVLNIVHLLLLVAQAYGISVAIERLEKPCVMKLIKGKFCLYTFTTNKSIF